MKVAILSTYRATMLGHYVQAFIDAGVEITALILDSKDPDEKTLAIHQERTGGKLPHIPLHVFQDKKIPIYCVENHNSESCAQLVRSLNLDLLVNAGTPRILKPILLDAPKIGVLSCHPGILPTYRGCTCVEWAIFNDDQVGLSVHFMNPKIDEGPTVISKPLTFKKGESYQDIRVQVYQGSQKLLAQAVSVVERDNLHPSRMQLLTGGKYYSPMEPGDLQKVQAKLARNEYRFQLG